VGPPRQASGRFQVDSSHVAFRVGCPKALVPISRIAFSTGVARAHSGFETGLSETVGQRCPIAAARTSTAAFRDKNSWKRMDGCCAVTIISQAHGREAFLISIGGENGFEVDDRSAVDGLQPLDIEAAVALHVEDFCTVQPDGIRAVRRASREYSGQPIRQITSRIHFANGAQGLVSRDRR